MKSHFYDCILIGLGAMGSSAAYQLAKKGKKVLGLEQFACAHNRGSSHGETRLIRKAYFEHPDYVPLLQRSYELWNELEKSSGKKLLHQTGLVIFGDPKNSEVIRGVKLSSQKYGIPIEEWDATQISSRFPQASVPDSFIGLYESTGGYLEVENCVQTFCEEAQKLGADLRFHQKVISWKKSPNGFEVSTPQQTFQASHLVLTAGPWMGEFLTNYQSYFKVHRAPLFWFQSGGYFKKENGVPCFAFDTPEGFFYGFTEKDHQVKLALHRALGEVKNPEKEPRELSSEEFQPVREFIATTFKNLDPNPTQSALCFYTQSPDSHFILDKIPNHPDAFFAGGFSGHGFKFSSLVGEVLADWVCQGKTYNPVDFLKMQRLNS